MKSLIIYCSNYKGNTEKIAKRIGNKIGADLLNIKEIETNSVDVENYNLIGFGSGIYREAMSHRMYRLTEELKLEGKNVFVFSTSGVGMKFYNNRLKKLLLAKGAVHKGDFACKGGFIASEFTDKRMFDFFGKLSQGHPNENDLKKADEFIESIVD